MMTGLNNITGKEFPAWEQSVSSVETGRSQRGNSLNATGTSGANCRYVGNFLRSFRYAACLLLLMVMGVSETWGATVKVTYHIINLGRLDDSGQLTTSTRTEALKFDVTGDNTVTVGIPDKYKSPLAKNWKYYSSDDVTYDSDTKVCTFNAGPSLSETSVLSADADVYVTYELDEDAFSTVGVEDGGVYRIKADGNYYLQQTHYNNDPNTSFTSNNTLPTTADYRWKFNIVDPYQITIQTKSNNNVGTYGLLTDFYLCKGGNYGDIRLRQDIATAKTTGVWSFGLLPGGTTGTYRIIITDGATANESGMDGYGHGYINRGSGKSRYNQYSGSSYNKCDLTIEFLSAKYTFHIINNSNEEAMSAKTASVLDAGDAITESMIPDILKSPAACNYSFYPTAADAISGTHKLSYLSYSSTDIYVRYNTSSGFFLDGTIKYNLSVGGDHYLYADNTTTISSAATSDAADIYKWTLHGGDPYQFTIKNVDNDKYITYDVSGGEAVPTLSDTGSKFFIRQGSTSGKCELVAVPSNNYPTSYYTLGYDGTNGLKLYSSTNHQFGANEIQTVLAATGLAIINPLPTANDLTYNGLEQDLVTAGTCANGTIKYREGTTGEYVETIPTKKDAGTYHVYYMSVGNAGYDNYVAPDPIIVTIAPASVTVTAANKTKDYGASDPPLTATVTGLVNNESQSLITYTLSRATGKDVGNYTITPTGVASQGNYEVSFVTGKLTINKKTVGIEWGETNLPYNGTPQAPTATATGLVYNDEIGITVTGEQTDVGTDYVATASALTGTKAGNYKLPNAKTTKFSIVQGSINTSIVMKEWSYGDYNALTNSPSISFNPDNVTVTYQYKVKGAGDETYVAAVPTNVGTYTVKASMEAGANSYAQVLTKDFTIGKKALNKDAAGSPANGITVTVTKVINNQGTAEETISYPVTVTHNVYGASKTLTPYDADHPENSYDYTLSGGSSVSGHVVTVTAKNENGIYTGNYTGFAKAAYPEPTFYLDGATWSPSGNEYAAVYLGLSDAVPSPESGSEIKAYIVNKVNPTIGTVTVSPVEYTIDDTTNPPTKANYIPKGVPVLLLSNNENLTGFTTSSPTEETSDITTAIGYSNQLMIAPDEPSDPSNPNSLHGVAVKDTEAYIFYKGEFVLAKEGVIKPDYFFLYNPNYKAPEQSGGSTPAPRRTLQIVIEERGETGMAELRNDELMESRTGIGWYTIDGRRLNGKPEQRGLYIVNGKKVMVK